MVNRACRTFEISTWIEAPPERVAAFQSNFGNYARIHPLWVECRRSDEEAGSSDQGPRTYQVTEAPRILGISYKVRFKVVMTAVDPQAMLYEVWAAFGVYLHNVTRWYAESSGTRIAESVRVEAPRLLLPYVARQAEGAHTRMFANLKTHLEQQGISGAEMPG